MTFAIPYSPRCGRLHAGKGLNTALLALVAAFGLLAGLTARSENSTNVPPAAAARSESEFRGHQQAYQRDPTNDVVAWQFARACFDQAEVATNDSGRAEFARLGITAARALLARSSNSAPGHYYLGMNLGQLARTKFLGALPLVSQMETEFLAARGLDENLDFAGPDRNLGLLYLEAPSTVSVGSSSNARVHLQRAVELAPEFPENRLNLAEARWQWRDAGGARRELDALEAGLTQAREQFQGDEWAGAWADWNRRLKKLQAQLKGADKPAVSPRGKP